MKKFFLFAILILGILMVSTACTNSQKSSEAKPIDHYYYDQIVPLEVEENLESIGSKMVELQNEIVNEQQKDDKMWEKIEDELSIIIEDMEAKKKELLEIEITDTNIKEIHQHLIDTYDHLIQGYSLIIPAIKNSDADGAQKAQKELTTASEAVTLWKEKINK